ncbi:MAG TPA: hypothetical protein VFI11_12325 [Anaerolineales bacterium]|nr:hypothetical protein [Anaerolineales bacterium]
MPAIFKVSYVVRGEDHPGAILNTEQAPKVGDRVRIGEREFTVVEVQELIPPREDFHFLHATVKGR